MCWILQLFMLSGKNLLEIYLVDWMVLCLHRFIFVPANNHEPFLTMIFHYFIGIKLCVHDCLVFGLGLLYFHLIRRSKDSNSKAWLVSRCILMALIELSA